MCRHSSITFYSVSWKLSVCNILFKWKNKEVVIDSDIDNNLLNCDQHNVDYLDWIYSVGAKQVVEARTRYSVDFSSSSFI